VRLAAPIAIAAARRITSDASLAEDAAQEAFLKAFRALDRYRPQSNFRSWVRTIAIRCAIDLVRRRRPESPLPDTQAARPWPRSRRSTARS
jgi:RNA polymerase sigma-70 factor (ECF subfamily)